MTIVNIRSSLLMLIMNSEFQWVWVLQKPYQELGDRGILVKSLIGYHLKFDNEEDAVAFTLAHL